MKMPEIFDVICGPFKAMFMVAQALYEELFSPKNLEAGKDY